ncbi:MAG: Ig-like domain-containing protein [Blastocatellales bacterium]
MLGPRFTPRNSASIQHIRVIIHHSRLTLLTLAAIAAIAVGVSFFRSQAQTAPAQINTVAIVSAATFEESPIAPESIAAIFGQNLAFNSASATATPLPFVLAGAVVRIKDGAGVDHNAPLFFVSPQQINFLVPAGVAPGTATVTITRANEEAGRGVMQIAPVAPGLFSANASGQGPALGFLLSVPDVGPHSFEPLAEFDKIRNRFVTRPLELNRQTFQGVKLFFVLFGTGIRRREILNAVTARVGGVDAPAVFAGAQGSLFGLDQINIPIDAEMIRKLTGRGRLNVVLSVAGYGSSNVVEIEVVGVGLFSSSKINSFEPARALAGETVTIKGEGLAFAGIRPTARVGELEASVIEATDSQIKIKVPFGAETGRISVRTLQGGAFSANSLTIRTSISGVVEDTRRRPIPNVAVRLRATAFSNAIIQTRTNNEGVFILADAPADQPGYIVEIDGTTTGATPHFPRLSIFAPAEQGRDNQITKPISLQLATGAAIKVNNQGFPAALPVSVPASAASLDGDWVKAAELNPENDSTAQAAAQSCLSEPGSITLELPRDARVSIPCFPPDDCSNLSLRVTQVENSRAPVKLPAGQFGSTMTQISPLDAYFFSPGALTIPNTDCLPASAKARLFVFGQFGPFGPPPALGAPGRFVEFGTATVSPDGQRVTVDDGAIITGGIYFVSVNRPTAAIIGRVIEPNDDPREPLRPVRRAVITARGQEAITDGNGFFALRYVPVLSLNDRVAIEITYLRPEGRVERAALTGVAIGAGATASIGDLILSASNSNRPPAIIAAPGFTAEEGKTADLNFVVSDPDAGQTLQVSVAGPRFATLANRGAGAYSLRVSPGLEDAGDYLLTITATDNQNAISTHNVALTVFNTNQPPAANAQSVAGDEDTPMKITLTGADPDRNALSYAVVNNPAYGQLTGVAPDLTYTPDRNYFGADSLTFKVNDGAADSATATVAITIKPVNDAPVLNAPAEQKVEIGAALNFAVSAMEFDPNDSMTFMVADLPQGATFNQINATGAQFSWTPAAQQAGLHIVTFKVSDNSSPSLTTTRTVAISVVAPNAGPQAGMWAATLGPTGGGAVALLASGSNVFAGTLSNGVFRSTNGGAWKRASNGIPNFTGVSALARVGDTIIAAATLGVFRSTDNGDNWTPSNDGLDQFGLLVRSLAVKGDRVFAGTFGGVYVSDDQGKTWKSANKGLPVQSALTTFAVSGSTLFAAVDGSGLYRSNDDGLNWTRVNSNLPQFAQVSSLAVAGATLFAGVSGDGVYRSTDGGQNWTPVNTGRESLFVNSLLVAGDNLLVGADRGLFILPANGQVSQLPKPALERATYALAATGSTIYAGSARDGVFRSNDNGMNWAAANDGYSDLRVLAFAATTTETFAATDAGVFAANNQVLQNQQPNAWRPVNKGLPESGAVQSLAIIGTNLFAGSLSGVYRLDLQAGDQNRTWESVGAGLPGFSSVQSIAVVGDALFVSLAIRVSPPPAGPLVFRSTDQGKTWKAASNGLPNGVIVSFAAIGGKVFAATFEGVYVSSDNGDNWTAANNGLPAQTSALSLAASGTNIFAGTAGRGVFVSTDQGQNWSPASVNLPPNSSVSALLPAGSNLLAVVLAASPNTQCPNGGVFIDGRCWGGLIPGAVARNAAPDQFPGLFGVIPGNVFISTSGGQNWAPVMSGLDGNSVTAIGANGLNVFAGTFGQGVFTRQF